MTDDWKKLEGQVVNDKLPLQKLLGGTSYSAVFQTQSPNPQAKNIAIKFIRSGANADSQASLLYRASKLSHPNLLGLMPGGPCQLAGMDLVYLVMKYAEEDLGGVLRDHPLTAEKTRELLGLLLDVLGHIHSKGFVHSHIKPSNILSVGNQLKLSSDAVLPLGEPRPAYRPLDVYDAPEATSALVAASSDVWSLGVTLVELLTQHPPVSSPENQSDPVIPSTIPQPFLDIARQCLRPDPLHRWTTAQIADCLNPAPVQLATPDAAGSARSSTPTPTAASDVTANAGKTAPAQVAAPEISGAAGKTAPSPIAARQPAAAKAMQAESEMWQDIHYTWIVLCKNYLFHMRQNLFFRHRIPLAYTDPFSPVPDLEGPFKVQCDDCGKTYVYKPSNVMRYEGEVPKFTTHPLFW